MVQVKLDSMHHIIMYAQAQRIISIAYIWLGHEVFQYVVYLLYKFHRVPNILKLKQTWSA